MNSLLWSWKLRQDFTKNLIWFRQKLDMWNRKSIRSLDSILTLADWLDRADDMFWSSGRYSGSRLVRSSATLSIIDISVWTREKQIYLLLYLQTISVRKISFCFLKIPYFTFQVIWKITKIPSQVRISYRIRSCPSLSMFLPVKIYTCIYYPCISTYPYT